MMLFQPAMSNPAVTPWVKLVDTLSNREMTEAEYLDMIRQIYNRRNPHAAIGEDIIDIEEE
jgi:transposase InsO family protein